LNNEKQLYLAPAVSENVSAILVPAAIGLVPLWAPPVAVALPRYEAYLPSLAPVTVVVV